MHENKFNCSCFIPSITKDLRKQAQKSFHYKTTNIALLSLIDHYCIKLLMVFQSHFWKLTLLSNQTFKLDFYVKYFSFKIKMEDLPLGYIRSNLSVDDYTFNQTMFQMYFNLAKIQHQLLQSCQDTALATPIECVTITVHEKAFSINCAFLIFKLPYIHLLALSKDNLTFHKCIS